MLMNVPYRKLSTPIDDTIKQKLLRFWENHFNTNYSWLVPVLEGEEAEYNEDIFYLFEDGDKIISTVHMTINKKSGLAGLGEVATDPEYGGKGFAYNLCKCAIEEYDKNYGQAIFLGTVNPIAARLYRKFNWLYLSGTKVMARTNRTELPEEFLINLFKSIETTTLGLNKLTPDARVNIIPAMVFPNRWIVLDILAGKLSTRYYEQKSCLGLYNSYAELAKNVNSDVYVIEDRAHSMVCGIITIAR